MHKVTLYGEPKGRVIAVMVVYNGMEFLQAGIESTLAELGPDNSLLVVDNDSTDGSFEFVRENYPEVCVLQTHDNLGGAGGFSAGMQVACEVDDAEFVWLLDNDIVVEDGALPPLIKCLEQHINAAAAGSQICLYNDPHTVQELGAKYSHWLGNIKGVYRGEARRTGLKPFEVDYTAACSTLARKNVIQKIGRFSDIFIFYDDIDWALRAKAAGYSIWAVPNSVIRHNYSGLKPIQPWREYYRKRNRLLCLNTFPPLRSRLGALYIYLAYLNSIISFHHLAGSAALANAYARAREDYLAGKLGKRDLDEFDTFVLPELSTSGLDMELIALDPKLEPGTRSTLCQQLYAQQGSNTSQRLSKTIIVSHNLSLSSALASNVYRITDSSLTRLRSPLMRWVYVQMIRAASLAGGSVLAVHDSLASFLNRKSISAPPIEFQVIQCRT